MVPLPQNQLHHLVSTVAQSGQTSCGSREGLSHYSSHHRDGGGEGWSVWDPQHSWHGVGGVLIHMHIYIEREITIHLINSPNLSSIEPDSG